MLILNIDLNNFIINFLIISFIKLFSYSFNIFLIFLPLNNVFILLFYYYFIPNYYYYLFI
jgi:hypothetical protein